MMEMDATLTANVMEELLKHAKFNIPTRNAMENAVRLLKYNDTEAELEGGNNTYYFVCGECRRLLDTSDKYCRECGRKIIWT